MKNIFPGVQTCFTRVAMAALSLAALSVTIQLKAADEYWRTDGNTTKSWTDTSWNIGSATATGGTGWTSGNNAVFTANSTNTYVTAILFSNVTVSGGVTVAVTAAGTASAGAHTYDIDNGSTLTWSSQNFTASGTSFIKNNAGTWNIGSIGNAYNGGFTLNGGTVIVSGDNSLGAAALNVNGGTIQSSGTRAFAATSLTIGGDFTLSGTGNATFGMATGLGAVTRNITNSTTSGSRIFSGVISGNAGVGLNFWGSGLGQIYIGNAGNSNTFSGLITINGAEVGFANDGSFGAAPASATTNAIVVDGGRLTASDTGGNAVTYTLNSNRGIQVGATAGTSISVGGSAGFLTYNGVIADKTGSTGTFIKQGAGTISLGGVSTYSGNTTNNNGTIQLTTGNNRLPVGTVFATGSSGKTCVLDLNGQSQQFAGLYSQAATASIITNSSGTTSTLTITGNGAFGGTTPGVIAGALNLVMNGVGGTLTLGDSNTFTGSVSINGGILSFSALTNLGAGTAINFGGGTLQYASGNTADISVRTITLNSGGGTIDTSNNTVSFANAIGNNGNGRLTKAGSGKLTLTGANTSGGNTTIIGGTLALSGSSSIVNSTNIIIGGGATFDVSGLGSTFILGSRQTLSNNTSTANLNGNFKTGSGTVSLTYASGTPSLTNLGGTLTISNSTVFKVNNTGAMLAKGLYKLVATNGSGGAVVAATTLPTPAVSGGGITNVTGEQAALKTINGELDLVVDAPPVAGTAFTMGATIGNPVTVQIIGGKYPPTDADGDALTISSPVAANGTVTTDGANITYTATNGSSDTITYTISDGNGGSTTGTINVVISAAGNGNNVQIIFTNSTVVLNFASVPNTTNVVQLTTNLAYPILWTPISTNVAGTNGLWQFIDTNPPTPSGYYRSIRQ